MCHPLSKLRIKVLCVSVPDVEVSSNAQLGAPSPALGSSWLLWQLLGLCSRVGISDAMSQFSGAQGALGIPTLAPEVFWLLFY